MPDALEYVWRFEETMKEDFPTRHVLVVDDEPLIRWAMGETLAHAGYDVSEAASAAETLQRLAAGPAPDVILLDYRLPDSNDLGLLEAIRKRVPGTPVVMITAYGTPAMQAGALERGACRVLTKPIEMRDVVAIVEDAREARP